MRYSPLDVSLHYIAVKFRFVLKPRCQPFFEKSGCSPLYWVQKMHAFVCKLPCGLIAIAMLPRLWSEIRMSTTQTALEMESVWILRVRVHLGGWPIESVAFLWVFLVGWSLRYERPPAFFVVGCFQDSRTTPESVSANFPGRPPVTPSKPSEGQQASRHQPARARRTAPQNPRPQLKNKRPPCSLFPVAVQTSARAAKISLKCFVLAKFPYFRRDRTQKTTARREATADRR